MLIKQKKGIVLITTMLTVVLVIMLLSSVVYSNLGSMRLTTNFYDKENALMAAQSGAQYAITRLQNNILWKAAPSTTYKLKVDNFEVKEEDGNVWGILTSANGKKSVFRIKFNCEDGDGGLDGLKNSSNKIKSPYISTNNLSNSVPCFAYPADKDGIVKGTNITESGKTTFKPDSGVKAVIIPKATCNLLVEGFSGPAVREATLDNPINQRSTYASQIVELYVSIDPSSLNSDSVISAAGNVTASVGQFALHASDGSGAPNMRSLGNVALDINGGESGLSIDDGATVYYGDKFSVNKNDNHKVKSQKSTSGENITTLTWEDVPKAAESDNSLTPGTYVWVRNGGQNELRHYANQIIHYGKELPSSGYDVIREDDTRIAVNNKNLTIMFNKNTYVDGSILIRSDINEYGTRPIVGFVSEKKGDNKTTILTSTGNVMISGATIGNGAITATGDVNMQGPSILESDPGVGVSIYAQGDVNLDTIYNTTAHMEEVIPTPDKENKKPYDNVTIDPNTGLAEEKKDPESLEPVDPDYQFNWQATADKAGVKLIPPCDSCEKSGRAYCSNGKNYPGGITGFNDTDAGRAFMRKVYEAGYYGETKVEEFKVWKRDIVICSCTQVGDGNSRYHSDNCEFYNDVKQIYNLAGSDHQKNGEKTEQDGANGMATVKDPSLSDKLVDPKDQTTNYENYKEEQLAGLISRYQGINYSDQEIAGVIYACGNINVNIGSNSRLNLTGSMVAYGQTPQKGVKPTKSAGKGNIYYKAKSVEMNFDPNYINKLLTAAAQRKVKVQMFANY